MFAFKMIQEKHLKNRSDLGIVISDLESSLLSANTNGVMDAEKYENWRE